MRAVFVVCHILLGLALSGTSSHASPLWPDYIIDGEPLGWEVLDRLSREHEGRSFHEYLQGARPYADRFAQEVEGRAFVAAHVSALIVGDHATQLALYTAYAEEASFRRDEDGVLRISAFNGMNVSHRVVREMFEELMSGVTVGPGGLLEGVGTLMVDLGSERNTTPVTIDFDRGTITPALEVEDSFGGHRQVTVADVSAFVSLFVPVGALQDHAITIFVGMPDLPTIRHELLHALYAADESYRQQVVERVRAATREQRELAILFAAINYDVFDPDMVARNPHIVLDEAFNAYQEEGRIDLEAGRSWFSIGDFERAHDLRFSLSTFSSIQTLPLREGEHAVLREMYEYYAEGSPGMDERSFLDLHARRILDNVHCLRFLRTMLQEQHPDVYRQVEAARQTLLDAQI